MYYVYILHLSNKQFYCGFTDDLKRRYKEHGAGKIKSTKKYLPLKLTFYEAFLNKRDAKKREHYFKTDKGKQTLRIMLRYYLS